MVASPHGHGHSHAPSPLHHSHFASSSSSPSTTTNTTIGNAISPIVGSSPSKGAVVIGAPGSSSTSDNPLAAISKPWLFPLDSSSACLAFALCLASLILLHACVLPMAMRLWGSLPVGREKSDRKSPPRRKHSRWIVLMHRLSLATITPLPLPEAIVNRLPVSVAAVLPTSPKPLPYLAVPALLAALTLLFVGGANVSTASDVGYTRFGWIALSCTSIVLSLGESRNSLLDTFFGVPFERSLVWHRWCGVAVVILVALHGGLFLRIWTKYAVVEENLFRRPRIFAGFLATLFLAILFLAALPPVRRKFYTLFRIAHVAMFPLFLVFLNLHTEHAWSWTLPSVVFWAIDRGARFWRSRRPASVVEGWVLHVPDDDADADDVTRPLDTPRGGGVRLRICAPPMCQHHGPPALQDPKTPQASQPHDADTLAFQPGQYVFLHVPEVSGLGWHPVSIASGPRLSPAAAARLRGVLARAGFFDLPGAPPVDEKNIELAEARLRRLVLSPQGCGIAVAVKAVGPFTSRLRDAVGTRTHPLARPAPTVAVTKRGAYDRVSDDADAPAPPPPAPVDDDDEDSDLASTTSAASSAVSPLPHPHHPATAPLPSLHVALDGPYGRPFVHAREFPALALVAGGVGVTPALAFAAAAAAVTLERDARFLDGIGATPDDDVEGLVEARAVVAVRVVWAVRGVAEAAWFAEDLAALGATGVGVSVWVTGAGATVRKRWAEVAGLQAPLGAGEQDLESGGGALTPSEESAVQMLAWACGVAGRGRGSVGVRFGRPGRPEVEEALRGCQREAGGGDVGVVACGPAGLTETARRAAREMSATDGLFHFHAESFRF
ncbi:hypothetical protein HDU96_008239 [Phlyctochytrium bullatum]|nr:hypothetical protein HDU96_008239 [Phlyctochytrium bullatum]